MNGWESVLPFVLIVVVFWFLVVRPARNQQKRLAATQEAAGIGSEVMLGSGIYATVVGIGDDTFEVAIAPGTTMKVAKQAVVKVLERADDLHTPGEADPADESPSADQDR
ncbi:MAG: preprotein translocase subunit YajC [Nocardioides sp.]